MQSGLLVRALREAAWRYPLLSGGTRLVQRQSFRRLISGEPIAVARLRNGGRLYVRTDDSIGRAILLTGDYDRKLTSLCEKVLRPGDTVLDVGANVGIVAAHAARLVGGTGVVHAFEPQGDLVDLMERSMRLNGYEQVTVHPLALSDSTGDSILYGSRSSPGTASLETSSHEGGVLGTVPVRRAGDVFEELGLRSIRLLKLDIEGHEESFLRGAIDYFRRNTPEVIAFESQGEEPFRQRPVVTSLRELNYSFFQVPKALLRLRLVPLLGDGTARGFDFVAIQSRSALTRALT